MLTSIVGPIVGGGGGVRAGAAVRGWAAVTFLKFLALLIAVAAPLWATAEPAGYKLEVLAEPLEHPWSIAFLPEGGMLVTERPGRLRVIGPDGIRSSSVEGLPEVFASGQGGLLDVLLAEDFADSGVLFLSYAHGNADENHTRVARARFDGRQLLEVTPIFTTQPPKSGDVHYGGRMAWMPDGTLLIGTVPDDNPFAVSRLQQPG